MTRLPLYILVGLSLLPLTIFAMDLPEAQFTPGGVAIIELANTDSAKPIATFRKKKVMVVAHRGKWLAVVGLPLNIEAGANSLEIKVPGKNNWLQRHFVIKKKTYPEQRLTIKNKRKVDPNKEDMKKIRADRIKIAKAKGHWSDKIMASRFNIPVKGIRSSQFGLKRFFNNKPRRPHGGLDIAAEKGTPVYAPADGTVIEGDNFFFSGNCIFIDHGQGLQTFYAHLSKIDVKPGQTVKRGDKIAEVGESGRVTGPHLHWSVGLNQTWVDPDLFLN